MLFPFLVLITLWLIVLTVTQVTLSNKLNTRLQGVWHRLNVLDGRSGYIAPYPSDQFVSTLDLVNALYRHFKLKREIVKHPAQSASVEIQISPRQSED